MSNRVQIESTSDLMHLCELEARANGTVSLLITAKRKDINNPSNGEAGISGILPFRLTKQILMPLEEESKA